MSDMWPKRILNTLPEWAEAWGAWNRSGASDMRIRERGPARKAEPEMFHYRKAMSGEIVSMVVNPKNLFKR